MATFWNKVRALAGMPTVMVKGRSFVISGITDDSLTVVLQSTGNPRPIKRHKFDEAWRRAAGVSEHPNAATKEQLKSGHRG